MLAASQQFAISLFFLTSSLIQSGVVECKSDTRERRQHRNTNSKAILLYHVTNTESIKIIDKARRVSFLDENGSKYLDLKTPDQNEQLPNLYTLLYSGDKYVLLGTREKILNVSLDTLALNEQSNVRITLLLLY